MNHRILHGTFAAFASQVNKLVEQESSAVTLKDVALVGNNSISALASIDHSRGSQVSGSLVSVKVLRGEGPEVESKLNGLIVENPHVRPIRLMTVPPQPEKKAASSAEAGGTAKKVKTVAVLLVGTFQP